MNRRGFLRRAGIIPLLPVLWSQLPNPGRAGGTESNALVRRVRPLDPAWPSATAWDRLNQDVGGRLMRVPPPLAACENAADSTPCHDTINGLKNPYNIGDQPGATQTSGWVDAWMSAPSVYVVAVRTTADVVAAVNFARGNNLRLVVKGGGHSYQGTSSAADSLMIWTRAMNRVVLHDAFLGQRCAGSEAPQHAVTVEAGAIWIQAYDAVTTKAGRYVQGGGCLTVGVAGLVQSGGFGSFSKNYGTAAAGLLEAEIVTADGAVRIANACTNPDLFWGLKGGGGGSLGVVTKVTLRTRELPTFFGGVRATIKAASDASFRRLIGQFISFYRDSLLNPHWGETIAVRPSNTLDITMVFQGLDRQQADGVWRPFFEWVARSPSDFTIASGPSVGSIAARNLWNAEYLRKNLAGLVSTDRRPGAPEGNVWWADNQGEVGFFLHGYESAWLPASLLNEDRQRRFTDALFAATRHWPVALHFNKGLGGAPADAVTAVRNTATNPAVLTAFALAIIAGAGPPAYPGIPGHEPDLAAARKHSRDIGLAMQELRAVVPDAGSYVSESNFFDKTWQRSFWGPNYLRLQAVKAKYDPAGLFFVHHGVGSEDWSADGFTRLAAP
ncbi:MAG: FAD-binding oxidoreductase [Candidatus Rokubacteria bacterium]|nr:FAD-binding oxidoreductase [Candidatus Rokubacteria bacterium]